jgi:hypothetical protein
MAKQAPQQRRPEVAQPQQATAQRARVSTMETPSKSFFSGNNDELVFGQQNFLWMAIGAGLILLGLLLMLGGEQPDPNVWDENIIYSARIITIAPIIIISGVIVEIYAIFKD